MFSNSCIDDTQCSDNWIIIVIIMSSLAYSIFFIFQEDLGSYFFSNSYKNKNDVKQNVNTSHSAEFLITVFYYFQDVSLLNVTTPYMNSETDIISSLKVIIAGLFEMRFTVFHLVKDVCVLPGISVAQKIFLKSLFSPLIWFTSLILHSVANCKRAFGSGMTIRTARAFVLAVLFTMQTFGTSLFTLVTCINIIGSNVLLVQGNIICYTIWQKSIIVWLTVSAVPFGLFICLSTTFLQSGQLSFPMFATGCIFPLPFIFYCLYLQLYSSSYREKHSAAENVSSAVVELINGPFRPMKMLHFDISWAGIILFRRTLLVLIYTSIQTPLLRMTIFFALCLASLLHHNMVWPYKDQKANIAEAISESALVITTFINVVRAVLVSEQNKPTAPTQSILDLFDNIDMVLQLWLPLVGICILFVYLMLRFMLYLYRVCRDVKCQSSS